MKIVPMVGTSHWMNQEEKSEVEVEPQQQTTTGMVADGTISIHGTNNPMIPAMIGVGAGSPDVRHDNLNEATTTGVGGHQENDHRLLNGNPDVTRDNLNEVMMAGTGSRQENDHHLLNVTIIDDEINNHFQNDHRSDLLETTGGPLESTKEAAIEEVKGKILI
jgi:hypothetical protein